MIVKDCKLDKPMNGEAGTSSVTGTVSYRLRIALPPAAIIEVQLLDVSLADAPDKTLAEEKLHWEIGKSPYLSPSNSIRQSWIKVTLIP